MEEDWGGTAGSDGTGGVGVERVEAGRWVGCGRTSTTFHLLFFVRQPMSHLYVIARRRSFGLAPKVMTQKWPIVVSLLVVGPLVWAQR